MSIPTNEEAKLQWIEEQAIAYYRRTKQIPGYATVRMWQRMSYEPSLVEARIRQAIRAEQGLVDDSVAEITRSVKGNVNLTKQEWESACNRMVDLIGDCEPLIEYADESWL